MVFSWVVGGKLSVNGGGVGTAWDGGGGAVAIYDDVIGHDVGVGGLRLDAETAVATDF